MKRNIELKDSEIYLILTALEEYDKRIEENIEAIRNDEEIKEEQKNIVLETLLNVFKTSGDLQYNLNQKLKGE